VLLVGPGRPWTVGRFRAACGRPLPSQVFAKESFAHPLFEIKATKRPVYSRFGCLAGSSIMFPPQPFRIVPART
jgi:hypothetical protein